jgi:hypothetical protein
MTPAQQTALEGLVGRDLTATEIVSIDPLLPDRNDVQIAAILSAGQEAVRISIPVEDVFDVLFSTGDYMVLKTAQLQGHPQAGMAFAVLADAKNIGPGKVNLFAPLTAGLLDQLQADGLLSKHGRNALHERGSVAAPPIHFNAVSDALNVAEGRLTMGV